MLSRYFHGEAFERKPITKHEHYTQRERIAELFGYRPWTANFLPQLGQQAAQIVMRDVTPRFVAAELIVWRNEHKIIRPGDTTLLEPLHGIAKALLPRLACRSRTFCTTRAWRTSIPFTTCAASRRIRPISTSFATRWQRYRQLSDNLVDAMAHHIFLEVSICHL